MTISLSGQEALLFFETLKMSEAHEACADDKGRRFIEAELAKLVQSLRRAGLAAEWKQ